jgi:hypothetical protein
MGRQIRHSRGSVTVRKGVEETTLMALGEGV